MWIRQSTDLISKVLSPAVKLWLRSQVKGVKELNFKIHGQDHQILKGYIPNIWLKSSQAVYQGLHLGEVELQGNNIRINIGQVLRGKPLQLLEPIWVKGDVYLSQENLQDSISADLFSSALNDLKKLLLDKLAIESQEGDCTIHWQKIKLDTDQFYISGEIIEGDNPSKMIEIASSLGLANEHTLSLIPYQICGLSELNLPTFPEILIDLGSEVALESLNVTPKGIGCTGQLIIRQ